MENNLATCPHDHCFSQRSLCCILAAGPGNSNSKAMCFLRLKGGFLLGVIPIQSRCSRSLHCFYYNNAVIAMFLGKRDAYMHYGCWTSKHQEYCPANPGSTHSDTLQERLMVVIMAMDTTTTMLSKTKGRGLPFIKKVMLQTGTTRTCQTCCCFDMWQTGAPCSHFPAHHTRSPERCITWQLTC